MLKKEHSLRKTKDIENVFKNGRGFYNDIFGIKFIPNKLQHNRFCIVISAKISQKATDRNKIRRRFKAIILNNDGKIRVGYDLLIIVKKNISDNNFFEISESVYQSLKKIKLII